MEELVKAVAAKTGLSHDLAKVAVLSVISHIKAKLPKVIADQIDNYLGTAHATSTQKSKDGHGTSEGQSPDLMGSVIKGLGGILGKK